MITNNPISKLFQTIQCARNPQQFMCNMIEEQMGGNPLMQNVLDLAKQNKSREIEAIARNMCKEKGLDFDKEFANFKNTLGIK